MGFKEMVAADRAAAFLDIEYFGAMYRVEGRMIPVMVDEDALIRRQGTQELAVADSRTLFYAREEDLPPRRSAGQSLNVNGRECLIDDWRVDMGMATIALRENITG